MIVFAYFSLGVVSYRIWKKMLSKTEAALLVLVIGSILMIVLQRCFESGHFHWALPERRYVVQATVVLYGWGVWGILQLPTRIRCIILPVLVGALATYHFAMIAKSHVPFGRRFAFVQASEWAIAKIKADYHGPRRDEVNVFSIGEYHRPNRPIVHGHNPRIGYLLGGRDESLTVFGKADQPDYWVTGHYDEQFARDEYELMDTFICGKRRFDLFRRKCK